MQIVLERARNGKTSTDKKTPAFSRGLRGQGAKTYSVSLKKQLAGRSRAASRELLPMELLTSLRANLDILSRTRRSWSTRATVGGKAFGLMVIRTGFMILSPSGLDILHTRIIGIFCAVLLEKLANV